METNRLPAQPKAAKNRARLRDFQTQLAQRIRDAGTAAAVHPRLAVRVGDMNILMDLSETGEIVSVPEVTRVPRTLPWYLGLANVRGSLIGVVDMGLMFGGRATPRESNSRAVLFAPPLGVNVAILATRVLGLRNVDDFTPVQLSDAGNEFGGFAKAQYQDAAGVQWTELSLSLLAQNESFLQIGA
jgi:twitching motility protein PilI